MAAAHFAPGDGAVMICIQAQQALEIAQRNIPLALDLRTRDAEHEITVAGLVRVRVARPHQCDSDEPEPVCQRAKPHGQILRSLYTQHTRRQIRDPTLRPRSAKVLRSREQRYTSKLRHTIKEETCS